MTFTRNPQFMNALLADLPARVESAGEEIQNSIKGLIDGPGKGFHHAGNPRSSSRPGSPPAKQSGGLHDSIEVTPATVSPVAVEVRIGSDLERSAELERGTATIAPRPFMLPGLLQSGPAVVKAIGGKNG